MSLNPFETVSDYPAMLNKVALFNCGAGVLATLLVRHEVPAVDALLGYLTIPISVVGVSFPAGTVLPAFALALVSRIVKLHDRISDMLGIRRRFDLHCVLLPMATASGANLSVEQLKKLPQHRGELMGEVFYRYADSSPGKSIVSAHAITIALDQWAWYWILVEAAAIAVVTAALLLGYGRTTSAFWVLVGVLGVIGVLPQLRKLSEQYALDEIGEILDDADRRRSVARAFRAL